MRIWGGLLPFIGFREEEVDADMRKFFDLDPSITHMQTFQLEWFGMGLVFVLKAVGDE